MEINKINTTAMNTYNMALKYAKSVDASAKSGGKPTGKSSVGGTYDTVVIDFSQSLAKARAEAAANLSAALTASASNRLESLQAAYSGGSVPVSAEEITSAILGV
jgi:hypothetical protein